MRDSSRRWLVNKLVSGGEYQLLPFFMFLFDRIPFLKRTRLTMRAARLRKKRIFSGEIKHPSLLPEEHALIASYPRSGNTWLSYLVADVILQQNGYQTSTKLPLNEREILPDLDRGDLQNCPHASLAPLLIGKTHLSSADWMHSGIFLFRQPADSLTSYFHFHNRYPERQHETRDGLDAFCRRFAEEWFEHAMSFVWTCEESERFVAVSYESLLMNPHEMLGKVLDHFSIAWTPEQLDIAVTHHTFQKHAEAKKEDGKREKFFRKGKIGSGAEELSAKTLKWIDSVCGPVYERAVRLMSDNNGSAVPAKGSCGDNSNRDENSGDKKEGGESAHAA